MVRSFSAWITRCRGRRPAHSAQRVFIKRAGLLMLIAPTAANQARPTASHRQVLHLPCDWPWEPGLAELFRRALNNAYTDPDVTQESFRGCSGTHRKGTSQPFSLSDRLPDLRHLDRAPRVLSGTPRLPFIRQGQLTNRCADHYAGHTVRHCKLQNLNWILFVATLSTQLG